MTHITDCRPGYTGLKMRWGKKKKYVINRNMLLENLTTTQNKNHSLSGDSMAMYPKSVDERRLGRDIKQVSNHFESQRGSSNKYTQQYAVLEAAV